jgi:hypothetical protein
MKKHIHLIFILSLTFLINTQTFSQTNYYGVSGNMIAGDFDNDGLLDDIAAFNTSGELPVLNLWNSNNGWMNESQASCRLPFDFLSAKSLNSKIVAGDFDNDGFMDDIASLYEIGLNQTSLTVWLNNKGEFTPQRWWYGGDFDANQVAQTMVVGDFDNDGFMDDIAAFYDYDQKTTKVFVWNSDGTKFAWPGTWWMGSDFNATRIQGTLVAGDFDHDGFQDDIAALYNYSDDFCKIFVWTKNKNKFNWPYTWFAEADFAAGNTKNNVVAGDFNKNGFVDNIAALYKSDENNSSILVFERNQQGFDAPNTWWYGTNEAATTNMRLVSADINSNAKNDQITGLSIVGNEATLTTWTAGDNIFILPENNWQGAALAIEDCENEGGCLPNNLAEELNLYPNPSKGQFTVELPSTDDLEVNIAIFNVLGSQVINLESQSGINLPIQMEEFKAGTYVIQITGKDFTQQQNFIIE